MGDIEVTSEQMRVGGREYEGPPTGEPLVFYTQRHRRGRGISAPSVYSLSLSVANPTSGITGIEVNIFPVAFRNSVVGCR